MTDGIVEFSDRFEVDPVVPVPARLALLDGIAREGATLPEIRGRAAMLRAAWGLDDVRVVGAAVQWVRFLLRYEIEKGEIYFKVPAILGRRVDDCDGYTCLTNAVLIAAGLDARAEYLITNNGSSAHVFSLVGRNGALAPLDATLGGAWGETPAVARVRLWGV